jgi:outer membrane protein OmpA-like peptidoglycan-associated protein
MFANHEYLSRYKSLDMILKFPMAPTPPTSLSATAADSSAVVSFTSGQDGLSPITNHEYRLGGTGSWTALSPADATSPVTVPGLTNGTDALIELRAVNSIGTSTESSSVTVTPLGVPSAPRSLSVTTSVGQASISFIAPINDGGAAITNYEVSVNGGGSWTPRSPAVTTGPLVVTGLTSGVTYQFAVRAVNTYGAGASSAVVSASIPSLPSGGTTTSEPTPTASPTPIPTNSSLVSQVAAPIPVTESMQVGQSLIVVNGVATRVAINVVGGRKWQVKGADFTLEFTPQAPTGELDGAFTAQAGTKVQVSGDGFLAGSLVASYLPGALADSLGQATVKDDSSFEVVASIPASLKAGQYVFQVNGLGNSVTVRSVNLGLQVLAAAPSNSIAISKRVIFGSSSAALSLKASKNLRNWVSTHKNSTSSVLIVPTVRRGASKAEIALARQRANVVVNALRGQRFSQPIRIASKMRVADDGSANLRTTVWVRNSPQAG